MDSRLAVCPLVSVLVLSLGMVSASVAQPDGDVRRETIYQVDALYAKLISLAEAVPDDTYDWRPEPGVRSFSEVVTHVAETNYFLMGEMLGREVPASAEETFTAEGSTGVWEEQVTEKGAVLRTLRASHQYVRRTIETLDRDRLSERVDWFDADVDNTVRGTLLHLVRHTGEHTGQLVAYARVNGIVPPWSR
jgi:uncharacterized damage-inducible protein DinB